MIALGIAALLAGCSEPTDAPSTPSALPGCEGRDDDGDGALCDRDCDDADPAVHPGAEEIWYDGLDQDCDGASDYDADGDGDDALGWGGGDCDDGDPSVASGLQEICDGRDADCDGVVDEDPSDGAVWYPDADEDGYGADDGPTRACEAPPGHLASAGDCDDADAGVNPGAAEDCADGVDTDCDGELGVSWYADDDRDGYGAAATEAEACSQPAGRVADDRDCDDTDPAVNPSASEICGDGADNDCDGGAVGCGLRGTLDPSEAHATFIAEGLTDKVGGALAGAGDVNGDGYADLLIGAEKAEGYRGVAYVVLGPVTGEHDLRYVDARIVGEHIGDDAAASVAGVGDVDGDGYGDVLVGAPGDSYNHDGASAYLVSGPIYGDVYPDRADAIFYADELDGVGEVVAGAGDTDGDGLSDVLICDPGAADNAGGAYLLRGPVEGAVDEDDAAAYLLGASTDDEAGGAAAGGDVDGDGLSDLLIGAWDADVGNDDAGAVYLVLGPVSGTFDLADADAQRFSEVDHERLGISVAIAGDTDGDGLSDLLVGASRYYADEGNTGAALLWLSPISGAQPSTSPDATLLGEVESDYAGSAVAGAGDTDGDGLSDLLVGAHRVSEGADDGGAAYLVLGPALGTIPLGEADGRLLGGFERAELGSAVAGVGDVDGDGLSDVAVGAPESDEGGSLTGRAWLLLGGVGL